MSIRASIDQVLAGVRRAVAARRGAELARLAGVRPTSVKTYADPDWDSVTLRNFAALEEALEQMEPPLEGAAAAPSGARVEAALLRPCRGFGGQAE